MDRVVAKTCLDYSSYVNNEKKIGFNEVSESIKFAKQILHYID